MLAAQAKIPAATRSRIGPDVDGYVIAQQPALVFATGQAAAIPLVFGTTTREFGGNQSADQLRAIITFAAGAQAPEALVAYGLANGGQGTIDPKYGTPADQWSADMIFRCPSVTQAAWHAAAHNPTWQYEFNHAIPGQEAQGAVHSADLPYVFGYFPKTGNISGKFTDLDMKLAELIQTYWTNFAKTGNPNSAGIPNWPQQGDNGTYIQFQQDGKVETAAGLRAPQCNIYRQWLVAQGRPAH